MKHSFVLLLAVLLLTGCSTQNYDATLDKQGERLSTNLDEVAALYTNVSADVWQWENELWQLTVVATPAFATIVYVDENGSYTVQADTLNEARDGLTTVGMVDNYDILMNSEPYHYVATSDVADVVDGWGTRVVGPYTLAWPEKATSTETSWQTDDTTFSVVEGATLEHTDDETVGGLVDLLRGNNVEDARVWYVEEEDWQGMAWHAQDTYYISIAWYDDWGMQSVVSMQRDYTKLFEVTDRYDASDYVRVLLGSVPIY